MVWVTRRRRCFELDAPPQGTVRESLVCTPNLQAGWDNLVGTIFEGLQEQSRSQITKELRKFIEVDNHEAVKDRRSRKALKPSTRAPEGA